MGKTIGKANLGREVDVGFWGVYGYETDAYKFGFQGKVWTGDRNLRVVGLWIVCKVWILYPYYSMDSM